MSEFITGCFILCVAVQARPEGLEKLVQHRSAIQTARIELSIVDYSGTTTGRPSHKPEVRTVMLAGDRQITIRHGDSDGVVRWTTDGRPDPRTGHIPYYTYSEPGCLIERPDDPLGLTWIHKRHPAVREDVRALGVAPQEGGVGIEDLVWRDFAKQPIAPHYDERVEGDLRVIEVRMSTARRTYWLDPRRNWSPVRMREEDPYGHWTESRSELERLDGVWFPRVVEFYTSRFEGGQKPAQIIRIQSAEFDRPSHPTRLHPGLIGMDIGTPVQVLDAKPGMGAQRWDGERAVPDAEFAQRLITGELTEGPGFLAAVDKARFAQAMQAMDRKGGRDSGQHIAMEWIGPLGAYLHRTESRDSARRAWTPWELYVQAFVKKFQLDVDQTQKADLVLTECEQRAEVYVAAHKGEFLEILDGIVIGGSSSMPATQLARYERLQALLEPLDRIFEHQLKPRLEKLPTRAQRARADSSAEQRP